MTFCNIAILAEEPPAFFDLFIADYKGRPREVQVKRSIVRYTPSGAKFGYNIKPGTYHVFSACITINGRQWGPTIRRQHFPDQPSREAAISAYVATKRREFERKQRDARP